MKRNENKKSVCLASYNGGKYIIQQIRSILPQLGPDDEILIGDDLSTDNTLESILKIDDSRIKLIKNKKKLGYIKNFESLMSRAEGEYIFLSDQDDIWPSYRMNLMIIAHKLSKKSIIVGKYEAFHKNPSSFECRSKANPLLLKSTPRISMIFKFFLGKGFSNYGSCMMIKRTALNYILPFQSDRISHDHQIALLSNAKKDVCYIADIVTYRRIHQTNITNNNRSIMEKLRTRKLWFSFIKNDLVR